MSAAKLRFNDNDGSWTKNKDGDNDYDGHDDDDDSNYDHSDDSDYDVYDDPDYTNENEYDTYDGDDISDDAYESYDGNDNSDDGNDTLCALCDDGGKLISCIGQCKRSFHPRKKDGKESKCKTLGYTSTQLKEIGSFLCKNCEYKQHQCFKCGELEPSAEPNAKVFKCNNPCCGHFYHPKCVAKLLQYDDSNGNGSCELEKQIMEGLPFTCPMHWCFECGRMENKTRRAMQFAICRRCPKSYHIECLPREISFETKDVNIEQRAWNLPGIVIIYCLEHKICKTTGNAKRDHIKFPQSPKISKIQDVAKEKGRMVCKRKRSALQHMALKPKSSTWRFKEDLQIEQYMVKTTDHCFKEDLQIEPSLVGATNQCSQITLKWNKRKPRSSSPFLMRNRLLSCDVGIKTKSRKTSRQQREGYSRKSYDSSKNCSDDPIQDNLLEDAPTCKDTTLENETSKITKDDPTYQEVNEGHIFKDDLDISQGNVSPKAMAISSSSEKSREKAKLMEKENVGKKIDLDDTQRCNDIEYGEKAHGDHSSHQYSPDHNKQPDYQDHTFGNIRLGGPWCNAENKAVGSFEYRSEQSSGSSRRDNLMNDTSKISSHPLMGISSHMEQRHHSSNELMTYYDRYGQHGDVNYSSNANYGPWSHVPLRPVLSTTEFDTSRRDNPYSYLREFQHDVTRWKNPYFHPGSHGYFISGSHSLPYYPTRPMHADYAQNTNSFPIHGYDEWNNFKHVGYNVGNMAPTAMYPPLQLNNIGAYQPHTHVRMQGHGATYGGHKREHGVSSHYTLSLGPRPQGIRSVMEKYAPNLEQTKK